MTRDPKVEKKETYIPCPRPECPELARFIAITITDERERQTYKYRIVCDYCGYFKEGEG